MHLDFLIVGEVDENETTKIIKILCQIKCDKNMMKMYIIM
jgi:hypothetical protein